MTLTIKNFQSHSETILPIKSPGINVITGPSDSGKSAILRAITLLAQNRPDGMDYRRHNTKETSVEWRGCRRRRGSTVNQYEVDDETYKALRLAVPKQVSDRLRLGEINFRPQHSSYFLIADSPGAVARSMNALADLGLIDHTASKIKSALRQASADVEVKKATKDKKVAECDQLAWAADADIALRQAEELQLRATELTREIDSLGRLIAGLEECRTALDKIPPVDLAPVVGLISKLSDPWPDELGKTIYALQDTMRWLDSCPAPEVKPINQLLVSLADPWPEELKGILERLQEYNADLASCPDVPADIARLAAVTITDPEPLGRLVAAYAETIRTWPDPAWREDLAAASAVLEQSGKAGVEALWLETMTQAVYDNRVAVVRAQAAETAAREEFEAALAAAGSCPLCGGSCA